MKQFAKSIYEIIVDVLLKIVGSKKDPDKAIIFFSFPRSGSTWLMNILVHKKRAASLFEPFNPYEVRYYSDFCVDHKIMPSKLNASFFKHFKQNIAGHNLKRWQIAHNDSLFTLLFANHLVAKVLRANYIVNQLQNHFPNKMFCLLRHPGAVIESMLRSPGGWHGLNSEKLLHISDQIYGDKYDDIIKKSTTIEEFMMINWCLEVKSVSASGIPFFFYEHLLVDEVKRAQLLQYLEMDEHHQVWEHANRPSKTTLANSNWNKGVEEWNKAFSDEQLRMLQSILDAFELHMYSMNKSTPST